jgi:hypothetical protein
MYIIMNVMSTLRYGAPPILYPKQPVTIERSFPPQLLRLCVRDFLRIGDAVELALSAPIVQVIKFQFWPRVYVPRWLF